MASDGIGNGLVQALVTLGWSSCLVIVGITAALIILGLFIRGQKVCCRRGPTIAFFHPYSNGAGGGERVLWLAVKALREDLDRRGATDVTIAIYSGDVGVDETTIIDKAKDRFGVDLKGLRVKFVFFASRWLLEAARYPVLTMLGQSAGSMLCAVECVSRFAPDLFIDTMGAAFTYPVASLLSGATVACYTHYPTITSEMTRVVAERKSAHNNGVAARHWLFTQAKLLYYSLFAGAYSCCGSFSSAVMANSSWTAGHLHTLWTPDTPSHSTETTGDGTGHAAATTTTTTSASSGPLRLVCRTLLGLCTREEFICPPISTVYPPCNSEALAALPLAPGSGGGSKRKPWILSVGQFRPEKDHALQLRAFKRALEILAADKVATVPEWVADTRLVLVGGARNEADEARVEALKRTSIDLGIADRVEWRVNAPFDGKGSLRQGLAECAAGIHSMWNEHFGISVVESQAAGCVIVAHDSGGPRMDIVVPIDGERTGCRARSVDGFAAALVAVLKASQTGSAEYIPLEEAEEGSDEADAMAKAHKEELVYAKLQAAGRRSALRFSDATFGRDFCHALSPALRRVPGMSGKKCE